MDKKDLLHLQILEQIEKEGDFTQRDLADKLQIALGLSNAYIRRLIEKGHVMITTMPRKRVFYNLTPKGLLEKSRLTLLYMRDSLDYYRFLKKTIEQTLFSLKQKGAEKIVIMGTGEIAEILFLLIGKAGMQLVAVVELQPKQSHFLGLDVLGPERLEEKDYDFIIVAEDVFGDTGPLAVKISQLNLPLHKIVLFSGQQIEAMPEEVTQTESVP